MPFVFVVWTDLLTIVNSDFVTQKKKKNERNLIQ